MEQRMYQEYRVEFLLNFVSDELSSHAPIHGVRNVFVGSEDVVDKESLQRELQRYFAGINEIPLGTVTVEILNFQEL